MPLDRSERLAPAPPRQVPGRVVIGTGLRPSRPRNTGATKEGFRFSERAVISLDFAQGRGPINLYA